MPEFICTTCHTAYPFAEPRWRCECGGLLDITHQGSFDHRKLQDRSFNMWRYREALPVSGERVVSFDEGCTPLYESTLSDRRVWFKLDYLFPSGSCKDRGGSLLISQCKAWGIDHVVEDSSGNAGAAIAAYCAAARIKCDIYVPADTSSAKITQIKNYGARLIKVPGPRSETAKAARLAAESLFYASHVWHPLFIQGTKTMAFEICEQLGWRAPDALILPVGNGTLLLGAYWGFCDLKRMALINNLPALIGIQSAHCAPLSKAFAQHADEPIEIEKKWTMAEGIAIANPARGQHILAAVRKTGGTILTVSEKEIASSWMDMAQKGLYVEPTSAAGPAGAKKYLSMHDKDQTIVILLTGHGLKK